jgi:hypothetical protein
LNGALRNAHFVVPVTLDPCFRAGFELRKTQKDKTMNWLMQNTTKAVWIATAVVFEFLLSLGQPETLSVLNGLGGAAVGGGIALYMAIYLFCVVLDS